MTIAHLIEGRQGAVFSCTADMTVRQAIAVLAAKRIGALPVVSGSKVAGIFSERDVIYRLDSLGPEVLDQEVGSVMTAPAVTVTPDTDVMTALALMTQRRIRHLPVVTEGKMIGFISIGDLVKYRIDRIEAEAEAMRAYIQAA
jgi:CBS domain-containing protein